MQAAMAGSSDLDGSPGICHALNKDTLEEVAAHCSVDTLLNLQQTCTTFSHLLANSERVWFRKLDEDFGLQLKALPANDTLLAKLAQTVYEASRTSRLRFQGALVTGGVDEDAMQYWVDNMFKPDKAPYCSNCSYNADCMALLLDGVVPRDVEFAAARAYMVRRCCYAAALIMNVQLPQQDRDPDAVMNILDDWSDAQLESFFRDLVAALNQGHALGRLLVFDIEHDRIPQEQQRIQAVDAYLRNRLKGMKAGMLKPPHRPNTMLDSTVMDKIEDPAKHRMAAVVSEVELSREGNLTCPVSSGVVFVGHIDYDRLAGLPPDRVLLELEAATQDPVLTSFNFLSSTEQVEAAAAAGRIPPISVTDQTLAGIWHEFDSSAPWQPAAQQEAQQQQQQQQPGGSSAAVPPAAVLPGAVSPGAAQAGPEAAAGPSTSAAAAAAAAAAPAAGAAGPAAGPAAPAGTAPGAAAAAGVALPAAAAAGLPAPRRQALHPPFSPDAPPPGGTPLQGQLVSWRPLVWFHFHKYQECVQFVREHHTLLAATAPNYASACVRYRGPQNMLPGCLHLPTVRAQQAALAARRVAAAEAGPSQAAPAAAAAAAAGPSSSVGAAVGGMQPPPHLMRNPPPPQLQQRPGLDQPPAHLMAGPSTSAAAAALQQQQAQAQAQWHQQQLYQQQHFHQHQHLQHQHLQQQQQAMLDPFGPAGGVVYGGAAMPGAAGGFGPGAGAGAGGSGGYASSQGEGEQEEALAAVAAAAAGGLLQEDEEGGSDMDMMGLDSEGEQDFEGEDEGEGGFLGGAGQPPGAGGAAAGMAAGDVAAQLEEDGEGGSEGEEEEDEDLQQQNVRAFYNAVAVASAEAMARGAQRAMGSSGSGGGQAAGAGAAVGGDQLGGLPPLGVVSRRGTRGRCKLHARLSKPLAGNVLLVKLVSQENLMQLFHDQHDWPNVDMAYVGLKGKVVNLPPGISLGL